MFTSIANKDISFFDENKTGDLVSRLSSDCETVQDGLSTNISMFVRGVVSIIVSISLLFWISWLLTVALVGSLIPLLLFGVWYGKKIKAISKVI